MGKRLKKVKIKKTVLHPDEINKIINTFIESKDLEDFSVIVTNEQIKEKGYSFSAGQYFEVKIEHIDITPEEFETKMSSYKTNLKNYFDESNKLGKEIQEQLEKLEVVS